MSQSQLNQLIITISEQESNLQICIDGFLVDHQAQNLSHRTMEFYHDNLIKFVEYGSSQMVTSILEIDAELLRQYLLHLEKQGHNPGGVHAKYRAVRAFLRWWNMKSNRKTGAIQQNA